MVQKTSKSKHVGRRRSHKLQKNIGKARKTKKVMRGGEIDCFVVVPSNNTNLPYKCPKCDLLLWKSDLNQFFYMVHKRDSVCTNKDKYAVENIDICEQKRENEYNNEKEKERIDNLKNEILTAIRANKFQCFRYFLGENAGKNYINEINENEILLKILKLVLKDKGYNHLKCNNQTIYLKVTENAQSHWFSLDASKDKQTWVTIYIHTD
jgi:hypothetical protein